MATSSDSSGALTPIERVLVEHVERGKLLDLAGEQPVDEVAMRGWDTSRTIRAWVLRDIVRGQLAAAPDPHGLRLRGARVDGRVDLENVTSTVSVELSSCLLDYGINAQNAQLAGLSLLSCLIRHPSEPALDASRITIRTLNSTRTQFIAHTADGALCLSGAQVGELNCTGARLRNDSGPALNADNLQVDRSVLLDAGFEATGTGERGAICLGDAHIGGRLYCRSAKLRNDTGSALWANNIQVDRSVFLDAGFEATGTGERGAVCLHGARIGGRLGCSDAKLHNDSGPALNAEQLRIDEGVFLRQRFEAAGAGNIGAVRLLGAHIGGQLDCSNAKLRNNSGPAFAADSLRVGHSVFLRNGFEATGDGDIGTIRLVAAHIGHLHCGDGKLHNDSGPALRAEGARIDQDLIWEEGFKAIGDGKDVALDLADAQVGSLLHLDPSGITHSTDRKRRLRVAGLTYSGLPLGFDLAAWPRLLREGTPDYAAQPYQQLAAAHRAAGHEQEARRVLIEQRSAQLDRDSTIGRGERIWARITWLTLGHGYQPWRSLVGLIGVIAIAAVLAGVFGSGDGLAEVQKQPTPTPTTTQGQKESTPTPTRCTLVERIGVGLDLGSPLISPGGRTHCDYTTTTMGEFLTISGWVLRLIAWAFATLFIAGFTGAVRKT